MTQKLLAAGHSANYQTSPSMKWNKIRIILSGAGLAGKKEPGKLPGSFFESL